ncbi:MAG: C-terminal binding protein [Rhodospirillales bacterium]|nr:C-terminal binding protein [Rhodospirillales bacterium]
MTITVLYPEAMYPDLSVERRIFGPEVRVIMRASETLSDLADADCADANGLMIFRQLASAADLARFPRLKALVRMGVGYDRVDRKEAAARGILVCNVPDYGTNEVADHALAMALALRRGLLLHHEKQRAEPPAPWAWFEHPLVRRNSAQTFGILGLGRIGTAAGLRAKAFGFHVLAYDPYQPNGLELALGIARVRALEELLRASDILSIHTPLTAETRGMLGPAELALLPPGAVVVNTARGPILDHDALMDLMQEGRIAGAGLDVLPEEPPVEPIPRLLAAYRARAPWLEGRLIVTPHSAFYTPDAWMDIRVKSAETMRAALLGPRRQNVIPPEGD